MIDQRINHLSYNELLKSAVDLHDLAQDRRRHFERCPQCRHAAQRVEQRYARLGRMARRLTPEPAQAFRVPQKTRPAARWQSKPALAMGLAGALILFVTLWWPLRFTTTQQPQQMVAVSPEQELALMQQVDALVADALPPALQPLAAVTASNSSEDLIEWVLPPIDDEGGDDDKGPDPRVTSEATDSGLMLGSGDSVYFNKRGNRC